MYFGTMYPALLFKNILTIFLMVFNYIRNGLFNTFPEYLFFKNVFSTILYETKTDKDKIKIGLLTNEIPPVVYGGVATWIVNFMKMFEDDERVEVIPIFLEHLDNFPRDQAYKYPGIRFVTTREEVKEAFSDIDICVNNLWIALDTVNDIKELYPSMSIVSVCHSLIRMENITNMGSCYTNNFNQQEITFQTSDYVVLISNAEKDYYESFGYDLFDAKSRVIYNSYCPKYDNEEMDVNYSSNTLGYIGRHVPRKRPEIPILSVTKNKIDGVNVINMGVDYDKYDNEYWRVLEKEYKECLKIIPFTSDKKIKEDYWKEVGVNCITGIYEPFGYTICECLDRRVPVIVSNIDGPKEIIEEVINNVYTYEVDVDNYQNDINNFTKTLKDTLLIDPNIRKENAEKARKALDKLRPEKIKEDWMELFMEIIE